jgi:hypothetical protein
VGRCDEIQFFVRSHPALKSHTSVEFETGRRRESARMKFIIKQLFMPQLTHTAALFRPFFSYISRGRWKNPLQEQHFLTISQRANDGFRMNIIVRRHDKLPTILLSFFSLLSFIHSFACCNPSKSAVVGGGLVLNCGWI